MTDIDLLAFGCGITFLTLGGVYTYLRERFREGYEPEEASGARSARGSFEDAA